MCLIPSWLWLTALLPEQATSKVEEATCLFKQGSQGRLLKFVEHDMFSAQKKANISKEFFYSTNLTCNEFAFFRPQTNWSNRIFVASQGFNISGQCSSFHHSSVKKDFGNVQVHDWTCTISMKLDYDCTSIPAFENETGILLAWMFLANCDQNWLGHASYLPTRQELGRETLKVASWCALVIAKI